MIRPEDFAPGWLERIEEAQDETTQTIRGVEFDRIPYGDDHQATGPRCRDCGVEKGQLHVDGCLVERCPKCGTGQAALGCCEVPQVWH
ncbi:hypothetical protein [Rhodoferax ferrireducens]|uniref:hypothetical protein n=1 Tax=Rhodoferax ferrireducens TaxID=192843 RepID=UPI003BB7059D